MPVTLTIKQVPDRLAGRLRRRAVIARRSLQKELLVILEQAAPEGSGSAEMLGVAERPGAAYGPAVGAAATTTGPRERLTLEELWQRARRLGDGDPSESAALIRRDRDAGRHRR